MAIHEKSLIEPERILSHDSLVVDGGYVSGHWNTMIAPRTLPKSRPRKNGFARPCRRP